MILMMITYIKVYIKYSIKSEHYSNNFIHFILLSLPDNSMRVSIIVNPTLQLKKNIKN